jgi:hypothetical protein
MTGTGGTQLVGTLIEMPRVGEPLRAVTQGGELVVSTPIRLLRPIADGLLVVTQGSTYILGAQGMIFRLGVIFRAIDAAPPSEEPLAIGTLVKKEP